MRLTAVVAARPHLVKLAPLLPAFQRGGIDVDVAYVGAAGEIAEVASEADGERIVSVFGLRFPRPRWVIDVGVPNPSFAPISAAFDAPDSPFTVERPDAVLVIGDLNATLAAAIRSARLGIPVVHLEAGLRCGTMQVPEEVNRVLISRLAAMHLAPTEDAIANLEDEAVESDRIHFVGNALAEAALQQLDATPSGDILAELAVEPKGYLLGTFHKTENLTDPAKLAGIIEGLARSEMPALIPDAKGIRSCVDAFGIQVPATVRLVDALDYHDMLHLEQNAAAVVTDSGCVQDEACLMCVPCVTVRECTERRLTLEVGANVLVPAEGEAIASAVASAAQTGCAWSAPARWDRAVSERVVRALVRGVEPLP